MYLPEYARHTTCAFQNTYGKGKHSLAGKLASLWKFFFVVYRQKTPGKYALCQASNGRHTSKKGVVILLSVECIIRHVAGFFAGCLFVALDKKRLRLVYFFTECIVPMVSCSDSSSGANTRHRILRRVLSFGTRPRAALLCTQKRHLAKTKVHNKDVFSCSDSSGLPL
jgi:hypothetical protein